MADTLDRYAVHFLHGNETTIWCTLDKQYLFEKWRGIKTEDDIRHLSKSLEEFTLKLNIDGLSLGKRSTYMERKSDLVRYFTSKLSVLINENLSVELYKITAGNA